MRRWVPPLLLLLSVVALLLPAGSVARRYPQYDEARGSCASPRQRCVHSTVGTKVCAPYPGAYAALSSCTGTDSGTGGMRRIEYVPWVGTSGTFIGTTTSTATYRAQKSDDDGATWTPITFSATAGVTHCIHIVVMPEVQRVFVTCNCNFTVGFWSEDLDTWTESSATGASLLNKVWEAVAWIPIRRRIILARPSSSATVYDRVATSDDLGDTFADRVLPTNGGNNNRGICYSPLLNRVVMVGSEYAGVLYSDDYGTTWVVGTQQAGMANYDWWSCAWSPPLKLFVMVASGPNGVTTATRIAYSSDGASWSYIVGETNDADLKRVRWIQEMQVAIAAPQDPNDSRFWVSWDIMTWHVADSGSSSWQEGEDCAYNPTTGVLLVVGVHTTTRNVGRCTTGAPASCLPDPWDTGTCLYGGTCRDGVCVASSISDTRKPTSYSTQSSSTDSTVTQVRQALYSAEYGAVIGFRATTTSSVRMWPRGGSAALTLSLSSSLVAGESQDTFTTVGGFYVPVAPRAFMFATSGRTAVSHMRYTRRLQVTSSFETFSATTYSAPASMANIISAVYSPYLNRTVYCSQDGRVAILDNLALSAIMAWVTDRSSANGTYCNCAWAPNALLFVYAGSGITPSGTLISLNGMVWRDVGIVCRGYVRCKDAWHHETLPVFECFCFGGSTGTDLWGMRTTGEWVDTGGDLTVSGTCVDPVLELDPVQRHSLYAYCHTTDTVDLFECHSTSNEVFSCSVVYEDFGGTSSDKITRATGAQQMALVLDPVVGSLILFRNGKDALLLQTHDNTTREIWQCLPAPPTSAVSDASCADSRCDEDAVCSFPTSLPSPLTHSYVDLGAQSVSLSSMRMVWNEEEEYLVTPNGYASADLSAFGSRNTAFPTHSGSTLLNNIGIDPESMFFFARKESTSSHISTTKGSSWSDLTYLGGAKVGGNGWQCNHGRGVCTTHLEPLDVDWTWSTFPNTSVNGIVQTSAASSFPTWIKELTTYRGTPDFSFTNTAASQSYLHFHIYVRDYEAWTGTYRALTGTIGTFYSTTGNVWQGGASSELISDEYRPNALSGPVYVPEYRSAFLMQACVQWVTTEGAVWWARGPSTCSSSYRSLRQFATVWVPDINRLVSGMQAHLTSSSALTGSKLVVSDVDVLGDTLSESTLDTSLDAASIHSLLYIKPLRVLLAFAEESGGGTATMFRYQVPAAACSASGTFSTSPTRTRCRIDVVVDEARYDGDSAPSPPWAYSQRYAVATCWTGADVDNPPSDCGKAFGVHVPCVPGKVMRRRRRERTSFTANDLWMCAGVSASGPTNGSCTAQTCPFGGLVNQTTMAVTTYTNTHVLKTSVCNRTYDVFPCSATCVAPADDENYCQHEVHVGRFGTVVETRCVRGDAPENAALNNCTGLFPDASAFCVAGEMARSFAYRNTNSVPGYAECSGITTAAASNSSCTGAAGYLQGAVNETSYEATIPTFTLSEMGGVRPRYCVRKYQLYACTTDEPANCTVSAWSSFSACSHDCYGYSYRTRTVVLPDVNGGTCPYDLIEYVFCSTTLGHCAGNPTETEAEAMMAPDTSEASRCTVRVELVGVNETEPLFKRTIVACRDGVDAVGVFTSCGDAEGQPTVCTSGGNYTVSIVEAPSPAAYSPTCNASEAAIGAPGYGTENATSGCNASFCVWEGYRTEQYWLRDDPDVWPSPPLCVYSVEYDNCNSTDVCDCQVEWTAWSDCDVPCGNGTQNRNGTITAQPFNGGDACPTLYEEQDCYAGCCPENCTVSEWSAWSACNVTCGGGYRFRTREVLVNESCGGTCSERDVEGLFDSETCNTQCCPVNCEVSEWGNWTECSAPCYNGTQLRYRNITVEPECGGETCPSLVDAQSCNPENCSELCTFGEWSDWSLCEPACGYNRVRERSLPVEGPLPYCPDEIVQFEVCDPVPCPVDCDVGEWGAYGNCSVPCGGGYKTRTRPVLQEPLYGGEPCPVTAMNLSCNTHACPQDCVVGNWSEWGNCSQPCGNGTQERTREILVPSIPDGEECPHLLELRSCNPDPCPVDCQVGEWSEWGYCFTFLGSGVACGEGDGERIRFRNIYQPALYGGAACPSLTETAVCTLVPCPVPDPPPDDTGCYPDTCSLPSSASSSEGGGGSAPSSSAEESGGGAEPDTVNRVRLGQGGGLPWWAWLIIGCSSVGMFVGALVFVCTRRRVRKEEEGGEDGDGDSSGGARSTDAPVAEEEEDEEPDLEDGLDEEEEEDRR